MLIFRGVDPENDGLEDDSPFPGVKTLSFQPLIFRSVGGGNSHIFFNVHLPTNWGKMFFSF